MLWNTIQVGKVSLDEDYIRVEQLALNAKREKVFKDRKSVV